MSNFNVDIKVPVKDIMSSPVITVFENDNVENVAKLITECDVWSIVVTDRKGNPVGIITERDIVKRVVARNLFPGKFTAEEAMTSPLRTIDASIDIKDTAKIMQQSDIRRLIVMDKSKMISIISSKDIVAITPALIEIIIEKASIIKGHSQLKDMSSAGYCEKCRQCLIL